MTERVYTLAEVTGVLGAALKRVPAADRLISERPLNLFLDDVVATLKALPVEPEPGGLEWRQLHGNDEYASPND